jgi:outer membrane protein assembly factor BamD
MVATGLALAAISVIVGCGGITMKNYPTAELQYRNALKEYQKEHYLKAIDGFQKVIYNFSGASMVDSAQYYLAMAYYQQKDYYLAAAEFERLVGTYPGSPFVDDGKYMAGLCYFKASPDHYGLDQDELYRAIDALTDFVTDNPESDLVDDAEATIRAADNRLAHKRYSSGRMYFRLGYYKAAEIYFQTVIDDFTDTEWGARALYYMGELRYKQGSYDAARSTLDNFLVVYPEHDYVPKAIKMLAEIEKKIAETAKNN